MFITNDLFRQKTEDIESEKKKMKKNKAKK